MKNLTAFYLTTCPYCMKAKQALGELVQENPAYGTVPVEWVEETQEPDKVVGHAYYYVPSLFDGTKKLYECQPGHDYDTIKAAVKEALDYALA